MIKQVLHLEDAAQLSMTGGFWAAAAPNPLLLVLGGSGQEAQQA